MLLQCLYLYMTLEIGNNGYRNDMWVMDASKRRLVDKNASYRT